MSDSAINLLEVPSRRKIEAPVVSKVEMFGISIDNVSMIEALKIIWSWLDGSGKHFVTTPNVDHVIRLKKDPEFAAIYKDASLVIADGMPLIWSSKLLGKPLKERVAGSDLFPLLCELSARDGRSVYFLGSMPGVAEKAAENLAKRFPGFNMAGCYSPPFGFEKSEEHNELIVRKINESGADILFVALGAPKQEKWTHKYLPLLNVKAALCVGASIDFEAGVIQRAPEWMQKTGFEWLWRVFQDPKRLWKRYLIEDMPFFGMLLKEMFKRKS